jgi:hypothetical protein
LACVVSSETDLRLCGGKERRRGFSSISPTLACVVSSETDLRLCGGKESRRGFSRLAIKPGFAALKFRFWVHAHAQ